MMRTFFASTSMRWAMRLCLPRLALGSTPMSALGYGGRPAARQAAVKASARAGTIPTAAQYPRELKDGGNASTCAAAALASSVRPSLANAAASRLWDTLKLGFD